MKAVKVFPVEFSAIASGDGYWGMKKGTRIDFKEIRVIVESYGIRDFITEIQFEHEQSDTEVGLCYTDSGIMNAVRTFAERHPALRERFRNIHGSEQGMQDEFYLSCDAELQNIAGFEMLEALGYEVEG